LATRS
ncbi:hypothetical protein VCHC50A2_2571B, partial [Vibrio cholerae HC-50A2]